MKVCVLVLLAYVVVGLGARLPHSLPDVLWPEPNQSYAFTDLGVSAFNIQVFGRAKMEKQHVVDYLVRILIRYDLVLIQEIRDISGEAILQLLEELNSVSSEPYAMTISERLGRSSSKEQYAYFYKLSKFRLSGTYQYPDDDDVFERPPYVARFTAIGYDVGTFAYAGVHVRPSDAVAEIDALTDVYDDVSQHWNIDDIIVGGDFNAGCSYVRPGDWSDIRLRQDSRFQWLIPDSADTTIAASQCPYDRLVLAGSRLRGAYKSGTARPFRFDSDFGLTREQALEVSDHVPVDMELR